MCMLGIEYEMFGQINDGLSPLPYEGKISIKKLFNLLAQKSVYLSDPFIPVYEKENLVALSSKRAIIALEPGGQIEIAMKPYREISQATIIFTQIVEEITQSANELGIQLFSMGIHPTAKKSEMAMVKKRRYAIMRDYMNITPGLGLDMMTRSCAIQVNLDFQNESDMVIKARLAAALVPFLSLLTSSSAFLEGELCSHAVERAHVWRNTDHDRTGIPSIIFDKTFSYAAWIDMVLDVPMYFIRRASSYINVAGASFRNFIKHGLLGQTATIRDFVDHMTTVFTEIRLKPILELRSPDSLPLPFANGIIAFTYALFYHDHARDRALKIFDQLTHEELKKLHDQVIDNGRQAEFRGQKVFQVTKQLLLIAVEALNDKKFSVDKGNLLNPLIDLVEENITCAEWIKKHFSKIDSSNLQKLISDFNPLNNPII
jgi:glutamate--cysteine ligase